MIAALISLVILLGGSPTAYNHQRVVARDSAIGFSKLGQGRSLASAESHRGPTTGGKGDGPAFDGSRSGTDHSQPSASAVQLRGSATWCAPTPRYCQGWGNGALVGAVRSFSWGDKRYRVRVHHGGAWVDVVIVSYCACPHTLIDLSPAAFDDLAPLGRGRIPVWMERVGSIPLPQTDSE